MRGAGVLLACVLAAAGAQAQIELCKGATRTGWHTCVNGDATGAVPYEGLRTKHVGREENYPLVVCRSPGWTKLWSKEGLRVSFISGDISKPTGATTIEIATGSPGSEPHYRAYPARGEIDADKNRDGEKVHYHRTQVLGAQAYALLERVMEGTERWWLWRAPGQAQAHRVGRRTLAQAAQPVLEACEDPG